MCVHYRWTAHIHLHTTYQHMYSVVVWEVVGELPHLFCAGHINDVDVNILEKNKKTGNINTIKPPFIMPENRRKLQQRKAFTAGHLECLKVKLVLLLHTLSKQLIYNLLFLTQKIRSRQRKISVVLGKTANYQWFSSFKLKVDNFPYPKLV